MAIVILVFMIGSISMAWQTFGAIAGIVVIALWILLYAWSFSVTQKQEEEKRAEEERREKNYRVGDKVYGGWRLQPGQGFHRFEGEDPVYCQVVEVVNDETAILKDPSGRRIRASRQIIPKLCEKGTTYYSNFLRSDTGVIYTPDHIV